MENWVYEEARKLLSRNSNIITFETGYGPSGLPHIGTFGEVARTSMVRKAFSEMSDKPTRLICFSDDFDAMRKVPDNIPNPDRFNEFIGLPLTSVPDPFDKYESFGQHMNAKLCAFLDTFEFNYEFKSSTETYKNGVFNDKLLILSKKFNDIMDLILPTLGDIRRQTYSPILPVDPSTGKILMNSKTIKIDGQYLTFCHEDTNELITVSILNGNCKLQWKPDLGMRWAAFNVDFEMYGKDHNPSRKLYDGVCKLAGGIPPNQFMFELFLDENNEKISKTKGNGFSIDNWLEIGTKESLSYYMFLNPRRAKSLSKASVIKSVDEFENFINSNDPSIKLFGDSFKYHGVKYSLLLNLIAACNATDVQTIWTYLQRKFNIKQEDHPRLDELISKVLNYHMIYGQEREYLIPNEHETIALEALLAYLETAMDDENIIMQNVYEIGKKYYGKDNLREWFKTIYKFLLGKEDGPRVGLFITLYGLKNTVELLRTRLTSEV